jgi:hypothetical protein
MAAQSSIETAPAIDVSAGGQIGFEVGFDYDHYN